MKHFKFIFLLSGIIVLIAFSCAKKNDQQETTNNSTSTGELILTSIQDVKTNQTSKYPDSIPIKETITFMDTGSILSWSGDCNWGWGKYSSNGNEINFPDGIFNSKVMCSYYVWDDYLYLGLCAAFEFTISSNQLVIKSNAYNLFFQKNPDYKTSK